jgi:hypothetical protein
MASDQLNRASGVMRAMDEDNRHFKVLMITSLAGGLLDVATLLVFPALGTSLGTAEFLETVVLVSVAVVAQQRWIRTPSTLARFGFVVAAVSLSYLADWGLIWLLVNVVEDVWATLTRTGCGQRSAFTARSMVSSASIEVI